MLPKYTVDYSIQFKRQAHTYHYSTDDPVACEEFLSELLERGFHMIEVKHEGVALDQSQPVKARLFGHWAMAMVAEHHQPDMPLVATTGGLSQGAPWRVSPDQEQVLTRLRDLTRGYGRGS